MNNEQRKLLKSVIDIFYENKQIAFSVNEVANDIDPQEPFDLNDVFLELNNDKRFLRIKNNQKIFISKILLIRKAISLNYYLSSINKVRLRKKWVRKYFNSLFSEKIGVEEINVVYDYLISKNLFKQAWNKIDLVFPIASFVSQIKNKTSQWVLFFRELETKFDGEDHDYNQEEEKRKIIEIINKIPERSVEIIKMREGLNSKPKTLDEIGREYHLTRERIRQIEKNAWKLLNHPTRKKLLLVILINFFIKNQFNFLINGNNIDIYFLFILNVIGIPWIKLEKSKLIVIGGDNELINLFKEIKCNPLNYKIETCCKEIDKKCGLGLSKNEVEILGSILHKQVIKVLRKTDKVIIALDEIGKPAHFSEIALKYNEMFSGDSLSDHNVQSKLLQNPKDVAWTGSKGTYALIKWGYSRPLKPIHEAVIKIVTEIYNKTGNPVPQNRIISELYKYRTEINKNSLTMALVLNKGIISVGRDLYIPKIENMEDNLIEEEFGENVSKSLDMFSETNKNRLTERIIKTPRKLRNKLDKLLDIFKSRET